MENDLQRNAGTAPERQKGQKTRGPTEQENREWPSPYLEKFSMVNTDF
jgi:hypothetical protein